MSLLKALFGPSQEEIWRQFSREVGGQFHEGGFLTSSAVQARTDDWIITLDTYTQGGQAPQTYTRLPRSLFQSRKLQVRDLPVGLLQRAVEGNGHAGYRGRPSPF